MRCEHYCASCFLIHHCRGFYDVCPYGRPEESSAEKSLIDEYHGFTDMTLSEKHETDLNPKSRMFTAVVKTMLS